MKKKFKKYIQSKGGLYALIGTISLVLIATFLIIIGVIYSDYNGDWGKIPEVLSCNTAIAIYVVSGIVLVALIYIYVLFKRKEDI